jgi:16S rRNA C1402 (ribose-2'-O) methylase RsmI
MSARVTVGALTFAAEWLRAYEDDHGTPIGDLDPRDVPEHAVELLRVAEWIDAEIARRTRGQTERAVAKQHGVDLSDPVSRRQVRAAVRRAASAS